MKEPFLVNSKTVFYLILCLIVYFGFIDRNVEKIPSLFMQNQSLKITN